jgi:hypothetical protein
MFETGIEKTIVLTAIALWFAHGWYLNDRLKHVHEKLDRVFEAFDGLRDYLYEIDPQFDDERESHKAFENGESMFAESERSTHHYEVVCRTICIGEKIPISTKLTREI